MADKGYLIGEDFSRKLRETVSRVIGQPVGSPSPRSMMAFEDAGPPPKEHLLSKTTSSWSKGSSQTLAVWSGTPGSEEEISGLTVTAWNKFTNIKANKWVMLALCNGTFYVISAEC